jgi:hypothetical protein
MGIPRDETAPFLAPLAAVLARDADALARAEARLSARFGTPLRAGDPFPFAFTAYYAAETGPSAVKRFLVYPPGPDADLAGWKRWALDAEAEIAREIPACPRPANIDPGYLTLGNVVLASTKDAFHRVWLGRGIFAEVEMTWSAGRFEPLPWTYADYRTAGALAFFGEAREALKRLRREARRGAGDATRPGGNPCEEPR